jgi:hypothetical protein
MSKLLPLALLVALFAVGCQEDSKVAATQSSEAPSAKEDAPSTQPTGPGESNTPSPIPSLNASPIDSPNGEITVPLKNLPPDVKSNLNKIKQGMEPRFAVDSQDWKSYAAKPVSQSGPIIAENIEKALRNLQDTTGTIKVAYESPDGNGTFDQDLRVKDSTRFKVPFIVIGDAPLVCEAVANGTQRMIQYGPEWRDKSSVNAPLKDYTSLAAPDPMWQRDFTQMVYQPLTHSLISWPSIIRSWTNGDQGYRLSIDSRDLPLKLTDPKGQVHTYDAEDFRLHAVRDASASAKYGKSEIEVVVDAQRWLPKTIRSIYTDKSGKKTWKIIWTCAYRLHQKVTSSDYTAPFSTKVK